MTETAPKPEFRPSWRGFHRRLWRRWALLLPLLLIILIIGAGPQIGFTLISLGAPIMVGGLYASLHFGRSRVVVADGILSFTGALRTRRWSTADIAHLVFVPQPGGVPGRPAPATLYAVTGLNERLFWLSGDAWDRDVQDAVADAVGAPIHQVPAGLTPKQIAERFPGTIGWTALRPWLFAILVASSALAFLLFVAITVTLVMVATGELTLPTPTPG